MHCMLSTQDSFLLNKYFLSLYVGQGGNLELSLCMYFRYFVKFKTRKKILFSPHDGTDIPGQVPATGGGGEVLLRV